MVRSLYIVKRSKSFLPLVVCLGLADEKSSWHVHLPDINSAYGNKEAIEALCSIVSNLTCLETLSISNYNFFAEEPVFCGKLEYQIILLELQKKFFESISNCRKIKKIDIKNNTFNFADNEDIFEIFINMLKKCILLDEVKYSFKKTILNCNNDQLMKVVIELVNEEILARGLKNNGYYYGGKANHHLLQGYSNYSLSKNSISKLSWMIQDRCVRYNKLQEKLLKKIRVVTKDTTVTTLFCFKHMFDKQIQSGKKSAFPYDLRYHILSWLEDSFPVVKGLLVYHI